MWENIKHGFYLNFIKENRYHVAAGRIKNNAGDHSFRSDHWRDHRFYCGNHPFCTMTRMENSGF